MAWPRAPLGLPTHGGLSGLLPDKIGRDEVKGLLRHLRVSGRESSRVAGPEDGGGMVPLDDLS